MQFYYVVVRKAKVPDDCVCRNFNDEGERIIFVKRIFIFGFQVSQHVELIRDTQKKASSIFFYLLDEFQIRVNGDSGGAKNNSFGALKRSLISIFFIVYGCVNGRLGGSINLLAFVSAENVFLEESKIKIKFVRIVIIEMCC